MNSFYCQFLGLSTTAYFLNMQSRCSCIIRVFRKKIPSFAPKRCRYKHLPGAKVSEKHCRPAAAAAQLEEYLHVKEKMTEKVSHYISINLVATQTLLSMNPYDVTNSSLLDERNTVQGDNKLLYNFCIRFQEHKSSNLPHLQPIQGDWS